MHTHSSPLVCVCTLLTAACELCVVQVYADGCTFHSCKKVLRQLQDGTRPITPGLDDAADDAHSKTSSSTGGSPAKLSIRRCVRGLQLISFHSTSKGLLGECGERGGYLEFVGFHPDVIAMFTKVAASSLSSGTIGQVFVGLMVKPPNAGEPSHERFHRESATVYEGLRRRAARASVELNTIPGLSSAPIQGAMYAFPTVRLPAAFVSHAQHEAGGVPADELWCLKLLEATGIVTVPGSGFGQQAGTHHFRMTILPADAAFDALLRRLRAFQEAFYGEWEAMAA